ncbi:USP domain-containing protein [Mycena sanguinolenta]|uniref:USP domain-containing protein n=1 Tax=Mycena sanguinolenta TaxID=230812 RepID=A0A8H7CFS0_9AGAR|nr:USP domain-containing protein [Mycena sanguinolenta]
MNGLKAAARLVGNYTKGYLDAQAKVYDATSNDPGKPSGTQMNEIAQMTYNQGDFVDIMETLEKRLNDKGKNWRRVFKGLTLLDHLLHHGSENVIIYFKDNLSVINTLKEYQYLDEDGKDQGGNVRAKAKAITSLLQDESRPHTERRAWTNPTGSMRDRMTNDASDSEANLFRRALNEGSSSGWGGGSGWDSGAGWDSATGYDSWSSKSLVQIDGRDLHEESWLDPNRNKDNRPGPGMLPPLLSDILHNPAHNLYSVAFTMPEFSAMRTSPPSSQSVSSNSSTTVLPQDAPSFEEVCASVPHPDAYYCPTDNGWVILKWGPENCSDSTGNVTHHFHRYKKAVDAHKLDVPFHFDKWDIVETVKHKRRVGAVLPNLELEKIALEDEPEGPLLDLLLWDDFVKEKSNNPQPGKTPEQSVAMVMENMLIAIQNKLWRGEDRMLRASRLGFQRKIGWSPTTEKVFLSLGFSSHTLDNETCLRPPQTDVNQPQGKQNRARLMRAWAEIGSWVANYKCIHSSLVQHEDKGFKLWVSLQNVRERYQLGIGGHPDQIPRNGELGLENRSALEKRYKEWRSLGMTPVTYTPELLIFAYLAQCRCDPERSVEYFSSMRQLVLTLEHLGMASESVLLILLQGAGQIFQQTSVSPDISFYLPGKHSPMDETDPHIRAIPASDGSSGGSEDLSSEDLPSKSGSGSGSSRSAASSTIPEPVVAITSATATKIPLLLPPLPPQRPHSQERTAEQTTDAQVLPGGGTAGEADPARLETERLAEERLQLEERRVQAENERIVEEQRVAAEKAERARIAAKEAEHAWLEAERVAAALLAKQKAADNTPSAPKSDMTVSPRVL